MDNKTKYRKVSSYEAEVGEAKRVVLLYSGGLDTSVMLKWLQDEYKAEVITLTLNLGQQHDDLEAIRQKALKFGAKKAVVLDVREEFANDYISKGIKANAAYQGDYHLSTPIGRAILASEAVEVARAERADSIAHGATGKGNDQVRIDGYVLTLEPGIKIIAPVREWAMDRNEEIKYAEKHGIPVPASAASPYSDDDNMWGITWEGGEIEDPSLVPPEKKFLKTYALPAAAPDEPEFVSLDFEKGLPVALNGKRLGLAQLISELNKTAGRHGVGTVHMLEDRIIGLKNRGIYEQPAAHVIVEAHRNLEKYVSTRQLNELKAQLDSKWAYLCYGAMWFDPVMDAINAFNEHVNRHVSGSVKVRLFKGIATVVALDSPYKLAYASFNTKEGYMLNTNASAGFIELYSLQMKIAKGLIEKDMKKT